MKSRQGKANKYFRQNGLDMHLNSFLYNENISQNRSNFGTSLSTNFKYFALKTILKVTSSLKTIEDFK